MPDSAADRLRANLDAAVYKHAVLGLIFLKYVSDSFAVRQQEIENQLRDPKSEYFLGQFALAEGKQGGQYFTPKSIVTLIVEMAAHGHVLTPGRYVGAEAVEDYGESFEEKMSRLVADLKGQFAESAKLETAIQKNLKGLGYG